MKLRRKSNELEERLTVLRKRYDTLNGPSAQVTMPNRCRDQAITSRHQISSKPSLRPDLHEFYDAKKMSPKRTAAR